MSLYSLICRAYLGQSYCSLCTDPIGNFTNLHADLIRQSYWPKHGSGKVILLTYCEACGASLLTFMRRLYGNPTNLLFGSCGPRLSAYYIIIYRACRASLYTNLFTDLLWQSYWPIGPIMEPIGLGLALPDYAIC